MPRAHPKPAADRRPGKPERSTVRGWLTGSLARFGLGALVSLGVNLGGTVGLTEGLGVPPEAAFPLALAAATAVNFAFTRWVVFRGTAVPWRRQLVAYLGSSVLFRGAEYAGFLALHTGLGVAYPAAIVAAQAVSFAAKFFFYRAVVFRRPGA